MQGQPLDPVQQKRAMEDPEVAKIVQDPAMAQGLEDTSLPNCFLIDFVGEKGSDDV